MKLHSEGRQFVNISCMLAAIIILLINLFFPIQTCFHFIIYIIIAFSLFMIIYFFRIPRRNFIQKENALLSSADGKVVVIEKVYEKEFFKNERIQISVFMSLANAHINWVPCTGTIIYKKYHPGKYFIASHPKSSELNEHMSVVIRDKQNNELLIRQIAGSVAKRIVCYAEEGKIMEQCSELGFIKFGSRVDIFLPLNADVKVNLGQKVKGGIDVIAILNK
mgnify:CR=1 FL=1